MAYDSKRLAVYGATGLLIATSIILGVQLIPIPSIPTAETGVLLLKITDAPPFMKPTSLNIAIDSIMIHQEGEGNETWLTFELDGNQTYDLVELENATDLIGADQLPAGNYTMIKMHVTEATADFENGESDVELTVPSGYIKIPVRFAIVEEETTSIILDVTYNSTVVAAHHHLRPVVMPIVEKQPVRTASVELGSEEGSLNGLEEAEEAEKEEVEEPETEELEAPEEEELEEEETEETEAPEEPEEETPEPEEPEEEEETEEE